MSGIQAWDDTPSMEEQFGEVDMRVCTCHPDDNPPVPCQRKYALNDCRLAASSKGPASMREGDGVTVKPLKWTWDDFRSHWIAPSPIGTYIAWCINGYAFFGYQPTVNSPIKAGWSDDEAKAAAQADFEQRIRAAILSATKATGDSDDRS